MDNSSNVKLVMSIVLCLLQESGCVGLNIVVTVLVLVSLILKTNKMVSLSFKMKHTEYTTSTGTRL